MVPEAPPAAKARFTEEVDIGPSAPRATVPGGSRGDRGGAAVALNDLRRRRVAGSLKPGLGTATYTVERHVVALDDQAVSKGSFAFTGDGLAGPPAAVPATPCTLPGPPAAAGTPPSFGAATSSARVRTPTARPGLAGDC